MRRGSLLKGGLPLVLGGRQKGGGDSLMEHGVGHMLVSDIVY